MKNGRDRKTQLASVQLLRAIAALLVLCMHEQYGWNLLPSGTPPPVLSGFGQFKSFGGVGVQVFFVVSGFIMAHLSESRKVGSLQAYAIGRVSRIAPLYWITSIIWLLTGPLPAASYFFRSVFFIPVEGWIPFYGLGWSLTLEMFFYVTFGIIAVWARASVWWMAVVFATFAVLAHSFPSNYYFTNYGDPVVWNFMAGALAQKIYRHPTIVKLRYVSLLVSLVWFAYVGYTFLPPHAWGSEAFVPWSPPAFLFALFFLSSEAKHPFRDTFVVRQLTRIGDASYSLYLTHFIVIFFLNALILRACVAIRITQPDIQLVVFMLAAVAVSIACHNLIEMPATKGFKKLFSALPSLSAGEETAAR
ncbi:acyltransferase family protein [Burkholderia ubonensis]|uniref:acyltransferase family protein n=1 Tax=Burkholderia ubonensis TaxID=101571 RepID=UPI00075292CE|nr:acyltransferase [Burkholderia ubonensis]KVC81375.1 hypothetical protein WI75_08465 [Burkholderia ubonensis]